MKIPLFSLLSDTTSITQYKLLDNISFLAQYKLTGVYFHPEKE